MATKMNIFITGIAGFLGSHLAETGLENNHEVSGCDNLVGGDKQNFKNLDVEFHKVSIEDLEKLKASYIANMNIDKYVK